MHPYLGIYMFIAMLWTIWALYQQKSLHPESTAEVYILTGVLNYFAWPVCMWIARFPGGKVHKFFAYLFNKLGIW